MNVRIVPRDWPHRTDLYGGIQTITSDGTKLYLWKEPKPSQVDGFDWNKYVPRAQMALASVAEILLDEEPGA